MTVQQTLGMMILVGVTLCVFIAMVKSIGFRETCKCWAMSLGTGGLLIFGIMLLDGGGHG